MRELLSKRVHTQMKGLSFPLSSQADFLLVELYRGLKTHVGKRSHHEEGTKPPGVPQPQEHYVYSLCPMHTTIFNSKFF